MPGPAPIHQQNSHNAPSSGSGSGGGYSGYNYFAGMVKPHQDIRFFGENTGNGSSWATTPAGENVRFYNPASPNINGSGGPGPYGSQAGSPGGGYGSYGGGGGGGGGFNSGAFMGALNSYSPQQYSFDPLTYQNLELPEYQGTGFYDFDSTMYDQMRAGLEEGLTADRASGMAAYGDARNELAQYQNPYTQDFTRNQPMDAAMQKMLAANGLDAGVVGDDLVRGVQADQAMAVTRDLLRGNAQMSQDAQMRALGGDQRRFNESLNNQGRNLGLGIDMALAQARSQYEKDKWAYGEQIAQQNYQTNVQQAMVNHQGQNQTTQANNQMWNSVKQANVQGANDWNSQQMQTILDLIASGVNIDPSQWQQADGYVSPTGA